MKEIRPSRSSVSGPLKYEVVIVGARIVGKSTLAHRLAGKAIPTKYRETKNFEENNLYFKKDGKLALMIRISNLETDNYAMNKLFFKKVIFLLLFTISSGHKHL